MSSLSVGSIILEWVFPALGVLVGNAMFMAPVQDVRRAVKRGSLGDLNPLPWVMMLGNCCGWVTYACLIKNWFVWFGNAPGFLVSVYLNLAASQLLYSNQHFVSVPQTGDAEQESDDTTHAVVDTTAKDHDKSQSASATTKSYKSPSHNYVVLGMVLLWTVILTTMAFATSWTADTRKWLVGIVSNLILLFFYGAPLSTIATVLRTRNTASLHIPTMVMNTANSFFWGCYGVAIGDFFLWVPNGIGAVLGGIQLVLLMLLPRQMKAANSDDLQVEDDEKGNKNSNGNDDGRSGDTFITDGTTSSMSLFSRSITSGPFPTPITMEDP